MLDAFSVVESITTMMPMLEPMRLVSRKLTNGMATDEDKTYSLSQARPRRLNKRELAADPSSFTTVDKVIELYGSVLRAAGAPAPKKGDAIIDACGRNWKIMQVHGAMNDQVWNCHCVRSV